MVYCYIRISKGMVFIIYMKLKKDILAVATRPGALLRELPGLFPAFSPKQLKACLTHRSVTVNGRVVTGYDYMLKKGDTVGIDRENRTDLLEQNRIKLLHEDDGLLAVSKPVGLLSVPSDDPRESSALHVMTEYLRRGGRGQAYPVHRLDKETSGVLLFAKDKALQRALQDSWNDLVRERLYRCICEGIFRDREGRISTRLTEDKHHMVHRAKDGEGDEAVTCYKVIAENEEYSLVDVSLLTGRKNQIRVSLRDITHPVAGDKKYSAKTNPLKRLCLHAYRLTLTVPGKGEMSFYTEVPKSFGRLFKE